MSIIEKPLQAALDQDWRKRTSEKTQWWFVVYFISQYRTPFVRFNDVRMMPATKGAFDLNVLEPVRWIVNGVLGNPPDTDRPKHSGLYNGQ